MMNQGNGTQPFFLDNLKVELDGVLEQANHVKRIAFQIDERIFGASPVANCEKKTAPWADGELSALLHIVSDIRDAIEQISNTISRMNNSGFDTPKDRMLGRV